MAETFTSKLHRVPWRRLTVIISGPALERSAPRTVQPCDINGDGAVNAVDIQLLINQALGSTACKNDLTGNRKCTVVDVLRIVNASTGQLMGRTVSAYSGFAKKCRNRSGHKKPSSRHSF